MIHSNHVNPYKSNHDLLRSEVVSLLLIVQLFDTGKSLNIERRERETESCLSEQRFYTHITHILLAQINIFFLKYNFRACKSPIGCSGMKQSVCVVEGREFSLFILIYVECSRKMPRRDAKA